MKKFVLFFVVLLGIFNSSSLITFSIFDSKGCGITPHKNTSFDTNTTICILNEIDEFCEEIDDENQNDNNNTHKNTFISTFQITNLKSFLFTNSNLFKSASLILGIAHNTPIYITYCVFRI